MTTTPGGPVAAVPAVSARPFDGRRALVGPGRLRTLSDLTVLASADVHVGRTLARLGGHDEDGDVALAAALATRAVRLGHVFADLATARSTATPEDEDVPVTGDEVGWPDPAVWAKTLSTSPLVAVGSHDGAGAAATPAPGGDGGPAGAPPPPDDRPLRLVGSRLYLDRYWRHERAIVDDLSARASAEPPHVDPALLADGLDRLFPPVAGGAADTGEDRQRMAAATAVLRRLTVIAGGPGTGKTTTVARVLALLHEQAAAAGGPPPVVALTAPTGKAAARLAEAVQSEAGHLDVDDAVRNAVRATPSATLHRLLGWQPGRRSRFRHDTDHQLAADVVVVDESSMVSLSLMAKLLAAVRPEARLVMVGDPRQLASVEAGAVLGDIVGPAATAPRSGPPIADAIVVLDRVHRFEGGIAAVAAAVEQGDPDAAVAVLRTVGDDVTWIEVDDPAVVDTDAVVASVRRAVVAATADVVAAAEAGDGAAALEALRRVQVLCAHRRGRAGATWWQAEVERWLRHDLPGYGGTTWYPGRPLLVTENDYSLGIFNGDTGVVVDTGGGRLRAVFDRQGEVLAIRPTRLAAVDPLHAMTVHKAQGSQFTSVVVVLPEPSSPVLTRELLYTAVTRARRSLTVIGPEASVRAAVSRPITRASGLGDALWTARADGGPASGGTRPAG